MKRKTFRILIAVLLVLSLNAVSILSTVNAANEVSAETETAANPDAAGTSADQNLLTEKSGDFIFTLDGSRWEHSFNSVRSVEIYVSKPDTGTSISFVNLGSDVKYSESSLVSCADLVSATLGNEYVFYGDTEFDSPGEIDTRPYTALTDCVSNHGDHYSSYYLLKGVRGNTFVAVFSENEEKLREADSIVKSAKCTGLSGKTKFSVKEVLNFYRKGKDTRDIRMQGRINSIDRKRQCAVFKYKNKILRVYLGFNIKKVKKGKRVLLHLNGIQKDNMDKKNLWTSGYILKK